MGSVMTSSVCELDVSLPNQLLVARIVDIEREFLRVVKTSHL
jgi:hypothetical protein